VTSALALNPRFPNLDPGVVQGYLDAPEHLVAEVLDGDLSLTPRPRRQNARAATFLIRRLGPFDDPEGEDPGGWVILDEPEVHLGERPDIVVPDLVGWRRERVPEGFFADDAPAHIDLAPDWVCEVLSPRTEAMDRGAKMRVWRREGVAHVWLLDPSLKTLEVYRWSAEGYLLLDTHEGDAVVRAEPFDARPLPLGALWAR
jgi:Uma2 family endonuclease